MIIINYKKLRKKNIWTTERVQTIQLNIYISNYEKRSKRIREEGKIIEFVYFYFHFSIII